jgi:hypothetical protein
MKPVKISPEEVRCALALLAQQSPASARAVEEHLAALTAERDEATSALENAKEALDEDGAESQEGTSVALRIEALSEDRQGEKARAERAEEERDALRERVQALEKEKADIERWRSADLKSLGAARSRLAAIREQVWALEAEVRQGQDEAFCGARRADAAESRLSAILQRAGDTSRLREIIVDGTTYSEAAKQIARFVVGEDGAGAEQEVPNVCEHGDHPAPEGQRFCSPECQRCEGADQDGDECAGLCHPPASPEPSTAEAFSTAWAYCATAGSPPDFMAALSRLGRRMGAMEQALCLVRRDMGDDSEPTRVASDTFDALAMLDTDAPAVFTLEEVEIPAGFGGMPVRVLGEATDGTRHAHTCRLVLFRFPGGSEVPYMEMSERGGPNEGRRLMALSTAVHALLNLGEAEIFEVGNRTKEKTS